MRVRIVSVLFLFVLSVSLAACGDNDGSSGLGEQGPAEIEAMPDSVKFPHAAEGAVQTLEVVLKNVGESNLTIKKVFLRDSDTPFSLGGQDILELASDGGLVLGDGDDAVIEISYLAAEEIPAGNMLMVDSDASNLPLLEIPVTVGQAVTGLVIFPDPVDFGQVLGGESKVIPLTISNVGTGTATIMNVFFQINDSPDFSFIDPPKYPVEVPSGGELVVDLEYVPEGGDKDEGELTITYSDSGSQALHKVKIYGQEVGPEISISPAQIEFGWVAVDDKVTETIHIHNMGQHDLKVSKIYLAPMSNEDIIVENLPAGTLEVKPGESEKLEITFAPTEFFALTSDPIGGIVLESNDSDEGIVNVPVYANIDAPFIKLDPSDKVDFGIVAQGWEIERTLVVQNVGHAALKVDLMEITGNTADQEFAFGEDNTFKPATPGGGEGIIGGEQKAETFLTFTNEGAATGVEGAVLHIHSNDPITPDVYVDLSAKRGGAPECKIGFAPAKLDFGIVAHGSTKTKAINVVNAGSGYCSWKSGIVRECTSWMGLMTMCNENSTSDLFYPQGGPIPVQDGMSPGTAQPIQILYKPPTNIPWIPIFEEYYGVFQVTYAEPYSVPGAYTEHKFPEADQTGQLSWNLHGSSGVADIAVLPPEIDFGLVTIGCYSMTTCVKVYNAGTAPLEITDIYPDGCGPEFQIKDFPELPLEVNPSQFEEACVVYLPQNEGLDECFMVIESTDMDTPVYKVPLTGEGTWETENTDYFTQISGKKVDILFVIDESGSMCGEQDNLADNFKYLTDIAKQWGNDFQLGITTTNVKDEDACGKFFGSPRIVDLSSLDSFPGNVQDVGCSGAGEQESGLETGRRALTPPNINDSDTPCNCPEDEPCPAACDELDLCVKGKCGGFNRGFLRPDAALEVVFVSDEEDQSPGSVPFYIDFYKSIKGFLNESMFHAHAIVGPKPSGCNISADEGADAGKRYIDVQEATGGEFGSICDESFAQVLEDIGAKAFGLQVQFFLSAQADGTPGNIKVWVDSGGGYQECNSGWEYKAATNSVLFDENGSCMPQAGDEIKIWYKMVCNTE